MQQSLNILLLYLAHTFLFLTVFRCMKLALVHDMAECIVGDIAPSDNISKAEKHRREEASDQYLSHYMETVC